MNIEERLKAANSLIRQIDNLRHAGFSIGGVSINVGMKSDDPRHQVALSIYPDFVKARDKRVAEMEAELEGLMNPVPEPVVPPLELTNKDTAFMLYNRDNYDSADEAQAAGALYPGGHLILGVGAIDDLETVIGNVSACLMDHRNLAAVVVQNGHYHRLF